jgi:hypothetical protein
MATNINSRILYKLTNGIGNYYVVAPDPTSAVKKLEDKLNEASFGWSGNRIVHTIAVVAKEIENRLDGKPESFRADNNLIL